MFRFLFVLQVFILICAIFGFRCYLRNLPNRAELGFTVSALKYEPVQLRGSGFGAFRLAGAWTATSSDPRFGAFSGLEVTDGKLLAVGDSGAVSWLDKPGGGQAMVRIADLPDGPGDRRYKFNRDAEAIRADPIGRGWWVSFERANQLWLFDRSFSKARDHVDFGETRWPVNGGIEGLVVDKDATLLFIEEGPRMYRLSGSELTQVAIVGKWGLVSEAIRLPGGRLVALERTVSLSGFRNVLLFLDSAGSGYRISSRTLLPLGTFDNMEGMAAERMPNGATRLWMIADDNFQRPMRTLLIALDMPPEDGER